MNDETFYLLLKILALVLIVILVTISTYFLLFAPSFDLTSCNQRCMERGFVEGYCFLPGESEEYSSKLGSCVVKGSTHCPEKGTCNCYCK